MNKKTILAIVFMTLLLVPVWTQSEADFQVTLTDDGQGVVIARYTGTVMDVRIPATIQGMPVREIGHGAFAGSRITSVVVPEGVTHISGGDAWGEWRSGAFSNCRELTTVTLPSTLIYIGGGAFGETCALRAVTLPPESSLTHIGNSAFFGSGLTTITLPNTLTHIGNSAFSSSGLTTITLPSTLTHIGDRAFSNSGFTSITWPEGVTTISYGVFEGSRNLSTVVIPEGVTVIGEAAFGNTGLTSIALPSTIERIESRAFDVGSTLTTVTIPDSVEAIEFAAWDGGAFGNSRNLTLASQAALRRVGWQGFSTQW